MTVEKMPVVSCSDCVAFGKHCPHTVKSPHYNPYTYSCELTVQALEKENEELRKTLDSVIASHNKEIEELKSALKKYHCENIHSVRNDDGAAVPCYSYNDCKYCYYRKRG